MSYIDFRECPHCKGDPDGTWSDDGKFSAEAPCLACNKTGERIINREVIDELLSGRDWLDERVSSVFSDYSEIFKIHKAYGVEEWNFDNTTLHIKQDTSCRGCYDTQSHQLPLEYLYLDGDERRGKMFEAYEKKKGVDYKREQAQKAAQLSSLEAQVKALKKELDA